MEKKELRIATYQLREDLNLGRDTPIHDVKMIIDKMGHAYIEKAFGDQIAGFSVEVGPKKYLIGFNNELKHTQQFKRFTLAHEIAHVYLPEHQKILSGGPVHRSVVEFASTETIEKEADYFAANLLAPIKGVSEIIEKEAFSLRGINSIAIKYNISILSAAIRGLEATRSAAYFISVSKDSKKVSFFYSTRSAQRLNLKNETCMSREDIANLIGHDFKIEFFEASISIFYICCKD